ncbi:hypothetical protein JXA80_12435 [bacterium]|nr:hypothetical protein [candidate division CSSED10-310 bacterium]
MKGPCENRMKGWMVTILMLLIVPANGADGAIRCVSEEGDYQPQQSVFHFPVSIRDLPGVLREQNIRVPGFGSGHRDPQVETLDSGVPPEADMATAAAVTPDDAFCVMAFYLSGNIGVFNMATHAWEAMVDVGENPTDVDIVPSGSHAIVVCSGADTLAVVDLATRRVETTIPVGSGPVAAAVAPDGSRAIVMNSNDQSVTIIDLSTWTVQQTVTTPPVSSGVFTTTWNTLGRFRYEYSEVIVLDDNKTAAAGTGSTVAFIDLTTGAVTEVALPDGSSKDLAVTRDGTVMACGSSNYSGTNEINLIDLTAQPPVHLSGFDIGAWNYNTSTLAFSVDGSMLALVAYPSSGGYSYLFFFDTATHAQICQLTASIGSCGGMAVSPDGQWMMASGYRSVFVDMRGAVPVELGSVDAFNAEVMAACSGATRAVSATSLVDENVYIWEYAQPGFGLMHTSQPGMLPESDCPKHVVMAPDGSFCLCANYASDNVTKIDMASRTVGAAIGTGNRPSFLDISPDGGTAICCNYADSAVSVIDTGTMTLAKQLPSKTRPGNCVISADGTRAYAVSVGASPNDFVSIYDLNGASSSLVAHLDLGVNLYGFYMLGGWTPNPALSSDGATLVIPGANPTDPCAVIIDTTIPSVVAQIDLSSTPDMPYYAAVRPAGDLAVVVDGENRLHFITLAGPDSALTHSMNPGQEPFQAVFSADGNHVFVSNLTGQSVVVIDCSTYQIVRTIPLPGAPDWMVRSGGTLFVSCAVDDINPSFNTIAMNGADSALTGTYEREYYGMFLAAAENPFGAVTHATGWDKLSILYDTDPQPTATPTPTMPPTEPPTTTPTGTPTGCLETGVTLTMPARLFEPGMTCNCLAIVCHPGPEPLSGHPLFVILDVYGSLFFAPSFSPEFDSYLALYPEYTPGESVVTVLPDFIWPSGAGEAGGIVWYAAFTDPLITELVGRWDMYEFGWTD